jgi:putative FmdB family regulatory protein
MPIFEYDCLECGEHFEFLQQRSDESPTCPQCGGERIEKAFSVFASRSAGPDAVGPCGAPPGPT